MSNIKLHLIFYFTSALTVFLLLSYYLYFKHTIKKYIIFSFSIFSALTIIIGILSGMLIQNNHELKFLEIKRDRSIDLALELRRSSDELTKMVRLYTITGDSLYKKYFYYISEIRDGKINHPEDYNFSFWDQVIAGTRKLAFDGEQYSIAGRMEELGFTEIEKTILTEAKNESDELISLEEIAMNAMLGNFLDAQNNFQKSGAPDMELARQLVHGERYLAAKSIIMGKINEFFNQVDIRTTAELNAIQISESAILQNIVVVILFTILVAFIDYHFFRNKIILPINFLEEGTRILEQKQFNYTIQSKARDEITSLTKAFNSMAKNIFIRDGKLNKLLNEVDSLNRILQSQNLALNEASIVGIINLDGTFKEVNTRYCEISKYKPEELIGKTHKIMNSGFHDAFFWQDLWTTISKGYIWRGIIKNQDSNGYFFWVDTIISPIKNENGNLTEYLELRFDVTDQIINEEIIKAEREKSDLLLNSSTQGILGTDEQGMITFINPAAEYMLGYENEELINKNIDQTLHPLDSDDPTKQENPCDLVLAYSNGNLLKNKEDVFWKKDGKQLYVVYTAAPIFKDNLLIGTVIIFTDITGHLIASAKFKSLFDNAVDGFAFVEDGVITHSNNSCAHLLGYNESEMNNLPLSEIFAIIQPDDKHSSQHLQEAMSQLNRGQSIKKEFMLRKKNAEIFPSDLSIIPIRIRDSLMLGIIISNKIETIKLQTELKEAKQKLDVAIKAGRLGTFHFDVATNYLEFDSINQDIHEMESGEFDGSLENYVNYVHPEDKEEMMQNIRKAFMTGDYLNSYRIITSKGNIKHIYARGYMEMNDKDQPLRASGVVMDATDLENSKVMLKILQVAIDQSPISVIITDPNGKIEYINPEFSKLTGYSKEEIIGANPRLLKSGVQSEDFYKQMWATITSGNVWSGNLCNKDKAGNLFWERAAISPVMNNKKKIINFIALKIDISQQIKFEDELELAKNAADQIVDTIPIPTAVTRISDGKVIRVNEAMVEFHQVSMAKILEHDAVDWYDNPVDRKNIINILKEQGTVSGYELNYKQLKDGAIRECLVSFVPLSYLGIEAWVSSIIDITEIKNIQKELEHAKQEAETATIAKSQFLATMSHEIRTPMNAIIGLTHLALKTNLLPKQEDYLIKIDKSAKALLGILNDILDFSKIEAGKFTIEDTNFDLEQVMATVSDLVSQKAQEKGLEFAIRIEKNVPINLIGDPLRVGQIITNYCSNAIKFTKEGEIVVLAEVVEQQDENIILKFSVTDTGIGLSDEQKEKMFHSFSQADQSTTRKYGGTGLGLAICKKLAQLMQGDVGLESEIGIGSTFYFTAHFGVQAEQKRNEFVPTIDIRGLKVLVCDDNRTARNILKDALEAFSFKVSAVNSGQSAIDLLVEHSSDPFDLVILDWRMPGLNGLETAKIIRNEKKIKTPTIIMVTAFGREAVAEEAKQIGIDAFINKPVSFSTLFDTIMETLGKETRTNRRAYSEISKHHDDLTKLKGANILLVEDNEINQQVASELLESVGLKVEIAHNGQLAIDLVKNSGIPSKYSMILMDLQMPVADGYEATRAIKKLDDYKDLPIVAMTADAIVGIKERCMEAGMQDYVTKPINPDDLFHSLIQWIEPETIQYSAGNNSNVPDQKSEIIDVPEISGLDISLGLKRVSGNKNLYLKILTKFAESNSNFSENVLTAIKKNDHELASRIVHTMKGVSGNIAAMELHNTIILFEKILKENFDNKKLIAKNLDKISVLLDPIITQIKTVLPSSVDVQLLKVPQNPDLSEVQIAIEKLRKNLEEYDTKSQDSFENIKVMISQYGNDENLVKLANLIGSYRYEEALQELQNIENIIKR